MEAYSKFAKVYDLFMDDVPYEKWTEFLVSEMKKYGIEEGILCELGCGTGTLTRALANAGFDMIGIDFSEDMLQVAYDMEAEASCENDENRHDILYLEQDIREFELYGTVKAFVSVCNTMNYLLEDGDMESVFRLVNNYLDPKGIFIFDLNTIHLYRDVIGNSTIAENREDASFIWENEFDEQNLINEYDVTFFERQDSGLYEKFEEVHLQRAYDPEDVKKYIENAGMKLLKIMDADTLREPDENSETLYFIVQENGK